LNNEIPAYLQLALTRYTSAGVPDSTFGSKSTTLTAFSTYAELIASKSLTLATKSTPGLFSPETRSPLVQFAGQAKITGTCNK